jgi:hypothetical protein
VKYEVVYKSTCTTISYGNIKFLCTLTLLREVQYDNIYVIIGYPRACSPNSSKKFR